MAEKSNNPILNGYLTEKTAKNEMLGIVDQHILAEVQEMSSSTDDSEKLFYVLTALKSVKEDIMKSIRKTQSEIDQIKSITH